MVARSLIFPNRLWEQCRHAVQVPSRDESFALGLARPCSRGESSIAYVVEHVIELGSNDYARRSSAGLSLTDEATNRLNRVSLSAVNHGLVPVHIHSHPQGVAHFSGYDNHHEAKLHQWLSDHNHPLLWSVVWPYDGNPVARLWNRGQTFAGLVRVGLQPVDAPDVQLPALERQNVFGSGLRTGAATLRVAIVGVGGIGFLVAEQLARCGFTRFVLVDPDHIEETNLNRLPGVSAHDIGRPKVKVAKRMIRIAGHSIGRRLQVHARAHDIYNGPDETRELVKECDLILALTDDELSRIQCLELALEGGAEFLQSGVDIRLDEHGTISGIFTEFSGAEVNRYCSICTGRLDPGQASIDARRYVGGEVWERALHDGYIPNVSAPAVMSLNSIAAGMLVMEIQLRLAGLGVRDLLQYDVQSGETIAVENIEADLTEECYVCGRGT